MEIQTIDFYGETVVWPTPDLIHCEPLETRSKKHNWIIRPHRHKELLQIFYLQKGTASAHLDSSELTLRSGNFLVVPQMCIHDFTWSPQSQGFVLFIAHPFITQLNNLLDTSSWGANIPAVYQVDKDQQFIELLLSSIHTEYHQQNLNRNLLIDALIRCLCIWLRRQTNLRSGSESPRNKAYEHYERFSQLVEENYKKQPQIAWFAKQTGVTAPHLNTVCRKIVDKAAQEIIHDRLILEAKRNLIYTAKSASEISSQLGFSEPSYFIRFFKRKTATTPKNFREGNVEFGL